MAEIRSYWLWRHLRAEPTSWVALYKDGRRVRADRALAFWFAPLGTSIVEVPLDDRELPFLVAGRSADFQDVHVNGVVTFRVHEPELLAERVDFSIDTRSGRYRNEPLDKLAIVVKELAQESAGSFVARAPLRALLDQGIEVMRDEIQRGLVAAPSVAALGLEIVATRVASVKPSAEVEKALEMPARERIQQDADEATFARRALAVEKERAIAENELQSQIELARREELLIGQRGQNEKKRVTDETANKRIEAEAAAGNVRLNAEAQAESIKALEGARVNAERARIDIYRALPAATMMGLAARELAGKLQSIEHLNLSPDLLGSLLERVLGASARKLEAEAE
ncbi:MAG TPA: SPFH domain-containing protein [Polyangia bacterium]|jgi:regulator of protease activity HflC (stomatin/prohibitin superfamily)